MRNPTMAEVLLTLVGGLAVCWLAVPASAQAPLGGGEPTAADGGVEAEVPVPPDPTEARLRRLEERDNAREAELQRALERVAELEQAAADDTVPVEEVPAVEVPAPPSGPTLRPLASMFTRLEVREGYADLGAANPGCFPGANDGDCLRFRASLGLQVGDIHVSDDIVAAVRFLPQVAGYWSFGGSGGVVHPDVGLYEGNLVLTIDRIVRVDVGRIVLNYGDQMVIGSLRWHPAGRSFDGARVRIQPEADGYWVDMFWTMLAEGGPGSFGDGDGYFYGAYAALGPLLSERVAFDVYGLAQQTNDSVDPVTGGQIDWSLRAHLGSRFTTRVDLVDLRAEAGLQVGRAGQLAPIDPTTIIAGHIDGEVGFNFADDMFRVGAHGFFASGDDPSTSENEGYSQLFPTAHAFLGWSDVMGGRTNVAGGALHFLLKPIANLKISLDTFVFARPQAAGDGFTGGEGDLQVLWLPGAGLRVRGMYALFVPSAGFWGAGSDPVHYLEVELGYDLP